MLLTILTVPLIKTRLILMLLSGGFEPKNTWAITLEQ